MGAVNARARSAQRTGTLIKLGSALARPIARGHGGEELAEALPMQSVPRSVTSVHLCEVSGRGLEACLDLPRNRGGMHYEE